jgi:hypothetical protein
MDVIPFETRTASHWNSPQPLIDEATVMSIGTTWTERKCARNKAFRQGRSERDTSIQALQSQDEETAAHRRNRIWRFIADQGGATCWEVEQAFSALHQTISAAISNLSAAGLLVDTGERRPTGSGRLAIVWGAVQ